MQPIAPQSRAHEVFAQVVDIRTLFATPVLPEPKRIEDIPVALRRENARMLRWWTKDTLDRDARECSPKSFYWRERFEEDRKW